MSPRALGSGLSKGQGSRFVLKLEDQNPLSISSFLFSQGQSCPRWLFQWLLPANPHSCPWSWAGSGATGEGRAMVSLAVHCCPSFSFLAIPPLVTSKRAGTHVLLSWTSQPAGAGCGGESLRHRLGCLVWGRPRCPPARSWCHQACDSCGWSWCQGHIELSQPRPGEHELSGASDKLICHRARAMGCETPQKREN